MTILERTGNDGAKHPPQWPDHPPERMSVSSSWFEGKLERKTVTFEHVGCPFEKGKHDYAQETLPW